MTVQAKTKETRGKNKMLPAMEPWKPAHYDIADAAAIQALARGDASPDQQKRALIWIVEVCSARSDMSFRPGAGGDRDTIFAEGKRWVGIQVAKLANLNLMNMKKENQNA